VRLTPSRCALPVPAWMILQAALAIAVGGCASPVPRYQWTGDEEALRMLAQRAEAVRTIEGRCTISMRHVDGRQITLDGALVARNPDHLRIRAWKLDHPAFDITAKPDGVWIDAPADQNGLDHPDLGVQILRAWSLFSGEFLQRDLRIDRQQSNSQRLALMEVAPATKDFVTTCFIKRSTLTPQRYDVRAGDGTFMYGIDLDRYRQVGEIVWPQRVVFESATGTMTIELQDVEFNGEANPHAFTPPRRAVRRD
jgi:hypothetical protein